MSADRLTITMPPEVADLSRRAAARAGISLSAWLTHAARRTVLAQGIAADLELLAQLGYIDDDGAEELAIAQTESQGAHGGAAA